MELMFLLVGDQLPLEMLSGLVTQSSEQDCVTSPRVSDQLIPHSLNIPDGYINTYRWYIRILLHSFIVDGESSHAAAARPEVSFIEIYNKADRAIKVNTFLDVI